ncbi:hypothetical protein ACGFYU_11530 [Streptomyces sp. NPDC048337]|uniref:hypothetical protein n=1 Tax=Streptomyces sp. NPDC048337 TaxID=3365535 RepID=UPI00371D47EA
MFREVFVVGFRFLWAHPLLRPLTVLLTLLTFVTMGATDLLIFRIGRELHRDAATLGYVIAFSGIGAITAAAAAGALRRVFGFGTCWLASVAMIGAGITVTGVSDSVPLIAVLAAVFMFGMTLAGVSSMTLRQQVTPTTSWAGSPPPSGRCTTPRARWAWPCSRCSPSVTGFRPSAWPAGRSAC